MPSRVKCPSCGGPAVADGDEYRYEDCGEEFEARPAGRTGSSGDDRGPVRAGRRRRDEDEVRWEGQSSNTALWVVIGILGVVLVGVVGVGALVFLAFPR